ncbi:MAG: hypothetical protein EAZ37_05875 [Burkholderiales bacterium]|nr:MAG: hypothetical protein EAZ37_05875 [Burkholderiales bacterium]
MCASSYSFYSKLVVIATAIALLSACASAPSGASPAQRYRCELGIEFSASFSGESVSLDTTRGYEMLFKDAKPLPGPPRPNEYRNPRMSAEFQLGKDGNEALLRYPLLPLAVRCVKDR